MGDVGVAEIGGVAFAMEDHVPPDPADIGFHRAGTVLPRPAGVADDVEQLLPGLLQMHHLKCAQLVVQAGARP